MDKRSFFVGLILVVLGGLLLANNLGWLQINWFSLISEIGVLWPWVLIVAGAAFWIGWIGNRQQYGLLLPGTVLLTYGLLFWYCQSYGWHEMGYRRLWAFFMIGPGLGFLAMYLLGPKERGYLVPGTILTGLGLLFVTGPYHWRTLWPVILILIGLRLLFKNRRSRGTSVIK